MQEQDRPPGSDLVVDEREPVVGLEGVPGGLGRQEAPAGGWSIRIRFPEGSRTAKSRVPQG